MDFKASKNVFILFSIVSFITRFIDGIKQVPILKIPLNQHTDETIYYLYIFIALFSVIHLIVERENYRLKFELFLIIILFTIVSFSRFWMVLNPFLIEISTSLLMSLLVAFVLHISIKDFSFIRSKEDSKQLKLPRIPVAIGSMYIFNILILNILSFLWIFFSKKYLDWKFIEQNYLVIVFAPIVIFLILFLEEELFILFKRSNWEDFKAKKEKIKEVYANHDRDYQQMRLLKTDLTSSKSKEMYSYIKLNDVKSIDEYYAKGNDPNELFSFGFTSLIFACAEGKINSATKIIEHGADLNIKNSKGRTALGFACRYNYHQIVKILLENGADPNECFLASESPLQIASMYGHEEVVKLLLESDKVDIGRKTLLSNQTALDLAMEKGNGGVAKLIRNKIRKKDIG